MSTCSFPSNSNSLSLALVTKSTSLLFSSVPSKLLNDSTESPKTTTVGLVGSLQLCDRCVKNSPKHFIGNFRDEKGSDDSHEPIADKEAPELIVDQNCIIVLLILPQRIPNVSRPISEKERNTFGRLRLSKPAKM